MKDYGVVHGSEAQAKPLIVSVDTVYVHFDIKEIKSEHEDKLYQYREIQYTKDEYIKLLSERNSQLEREIGDVQLALCELYEMG